MNQDEKNDFSIISYPTMNSIFVFGGSWMNINTILKSSSSNECLGNNCYIFSSEIQEILNPLQSDYNMFVIWIWLLTFLFVLIGLIFWIQYYFCSNNNSKEGSSSSRSMFISKNEKGVLIRNDGNYLWGGDAFSADLDEEELEWGDEAFVMDVEMK